MSHALRWLAVAVAVWFAPKALAHESWISHGALKNAAGQWCCGVGDCGVLDDGAVTMVRGGYRVDGFVTIAGESEAGNVRDEVHEFVPFKEAQPSPDGKFWRCKNAKDGSRRCFFAPPVPSD